MALVTSLTYTYEEEAGKEATNTIFLQVGFNLAQYIEAARAMAQFADLLVHGRIKPVAELGIGIDISALVGNVASLTSDVEDIGYFEFVTSEGRTTSVSIPGIKENLIIAGSHQLDQAALPVAAFIGGMTTGINTPIAGGAIDPCDKGEDDIVSLAVAEERWRNSGGKA